MTDHAGSYNGLAFGAGTNYRVLRLSLYKRATAIVTPDLPRYHGGLVGASYEASRTIEIDFGVEASSQSDLTTKLDALFAAFSPQVETELPLLWGFPGQSDRRVLCRPLEAHAPLGAAEWAGTPYVVVPFRLSASDPVIYDADEQTLQISPFTAASGFSWDAVWPISWGTGGSGGGETLTLGGDWETWPTFVISGPSSGTLTNPIVENVTSGSRLALNANGGVQITAGQSLTIETHPARRSIKFATGASRYGRLSTDSEWSPLSPGANEIRFRASGDTTGASLSVAARAARI